MTLCKTAVLLACLALIGHGWRVQPKFGRDQSHDTNNSVEPAGDSFEGNTPAAAFNPGFTAGIRKKDMKASLPTGLPPISNGNSVRSKSAFFDRQYHPVHHKRTGQPQMILERFTESAMKVIMLAQEESRRLGHGYVGDEMILLGVLAQKNGMAAQVLTKLGVELEAMRKVVEGFIGKGAGIMGAEVPFSSEAKQVLEMCVEQAKTLNSNAIDTSHILLALLEDDEGHAWEILQNMEVNPKKVQENVMTAIQEDEEEAGLVGATASASKSARPASSGSKKDKKMLEQFSQDLTKKAAEGQLDPIVGRGPEIERTIQVLARRKKNNPVLIGDPGVGKTAIAEGLATKIVEDGEDLPKFLKGKRILSLDLSAILAGTKYRGDFEERMQGIISEAVEKKDEIILMVDELHMLVGAGGSEGAMDAGNMLKPMLANGDLQLVGATTLEEYRKFIEKDKALERRFQTVIVPEPSLDESVQILQGVAKKYEAYHELRYTPEALDACVKLADQYIADRYLPDKAIDLLDETGARIKLQKAKELPDEILKARTEVDDIQRKIDEAVRTEDYAKASDLEKDRQLLAKKLDSEGDSSDLQNIFVAEADVSRIVAEMTGIKVEKVTGDESARLMKLEETLHNRVIGQEEAVVAVAKAVRRSRSGLKDPNRPIASFIFCGPTGVGKTELCKALTESYYGSKDSVLRFDMSEFMERHTVSKLIGSPPGYVGYNDESQLCDRIRRNPYSLVLFDEIEKAHPSVFNVMLQILEDGRLTDSKGNEASFKNALIIMTSNVGAEGIQKTIAGGPQGFGFQDSENVEEASYQKLKSVVAENLKNAFKPEFINRLDEVIVFKSLSIEEIKEIAELEFEKVYQMAQEKGINIELTHKFKAKVVNEGFDAAYGARPLRRAISKLLEDELAASLLSQPTTNGDIAIIDVDASGNVVVLREMSGT
mmetsp:Transcript_3345/g.5923  ORF Transcript_3345/g.5923 Transcript_3345/m.5923 type:complete len:940 (-) Transcript_3345:217-3036(-)